MLRLLLGNDQRIILPASALAGGTLLVLADTLARTMIAPEQLPVGVITASTRRSDLSVFATPEPLMTHIAQPRLDH